MSESENTQRKTVQLTPDQFTFNEEGQLVIDKDAVNQVMQSSSEGPEAGATTNGIGIVIDVVVN